MRHRGRKSGFSLILVLAIMMLVGGVVVGLTYQSAALHRQLRVERLRTMARYAALSLPQRLNANKDAVTAFPASEPMEFEISTVLSAGATGTGRAECTEFGGETSCEIEINLSLSRERLKRKVTVTLADLP